MEYNQKLKLLIDGKWTDSSQRDTLPVIDPATEKILSYLPIADENDLERALVSSKMGFQIWSKWTPLRRQAVMLKTVEIIRKRSDEIAKTLTMEMGKTLRESKQEINQVIETIIWCAEEGKRTYGRIIPSRDGQARQMVFKEPIGPVAAFVAWNFPGGNVIRKVASTLAAGCSIIIKPSEETPGTAVAIGECFMEAGLPQGVLNIIFGVPDKISKYLLKSSIPKAVTFTGSVAVGKHLQFLASETLKKCTLELGGHAPVIVCDDANIDKVLNKIAIWKFRNSGQVCISPSRFFVQEASYKKFVDGFVEIANQINLGSGLEENSDMGPLIFEKQVHKMESFVENAKSLGGKINCGGEQFGQTGFFFKPTVITDMPENAKILNEEPFGPLVPIIPFKTMEEAIEKSNSLSVGLASYIFTENQKNAHFLGNNLDVGIVCVNHTIVSVPEAPFGGFGESGYGKENGIEGLESFLRTKYITEMPNI
jgi:succinate-semialdehyde dehydrogenase/glutarate-semialdehyde dehydrogenase